MSLTKSKAIREALKELDIDNGLDHDEVVRIARERMRQSGGDAESITNSSVGTVLGNIRAKFGTPITRVKLEQYERLPGVVQQEVIVQRKNGEAAPHTEVPQPTVPFLKTRSEAVRQAMKNLSNQGELDLTSSNKDDLEKVVCEARQLLRDCNNPLSVSHMNVSVVRHEIKSRFGPPVTREKVEQYEQLLNNTKAHTINATAPHRKKVKSKKPSMSQLIRQVLKQMTPEQLQKPIDYERILVLVRTLVNRHKLKVILTIRSVREHLADLRARIEGPLTSEKIQYYEDHMQDYRKQPQAPRTSAHTPTRTKVKSPVPTLPVVAPPLDMDNLITSLHDAHAFASSVGGVDNAIMVLHKLKGLQS